MNPVLEWLQQHDGYSFDEGVAVLLRFCPNANTSRMIMCRRDRRHLNSELSRLAHIPNLRPLPGREDMPTTPKKEQVVQTVSESILDKDETETPQSSAPSPEVPSDVTSAQEGTDGADGDDMVTYLDLNRHERVDPETLPPTLKELWMKNRDEYKELQYCHAQMKQANSDAGRADWRKQVFDHRESLQARWKLYDEEKARLAAMASEAGQTTQEKPAYNPSNDRSYISNALKKETWSDEMKLEVQHRVETILSHSIPIKEETLQRLKERGISV